MAEGQRRGEADFQKALELEDERRQGRSMPANAYWPKALFYSDHVRYVEQLRRFEEHFPPERMLVLIYDDYRADNEGTVRRTLRFLVLGEDHDIIARRVNPSVEVRAPRLNSLLRSLVVAQGPRLARDEGRAHGATADALAPAGAADDTQTARLRRA